MLPRVTAEAAQWVYNSGMGKFELECGGCQIALEDSVALAPRATTDPDARTITLDDGQYVPASVMRVSAARDNVEVWSLTLTTSAGATTVHKGSALCLGDRVAVAIGPYVLAIQAATGAIAWRQRCDPASCFGIYRAPSGKGLISHGELQVAGLAAEDGTVVWTFAGKDIFTGPFVVAPEGIIATDFGGDVYALSFDGALQARDKGKPFPH